MVDVLILILIAIWFIAIIVYFHINPRKRYIDELEDLRKQLENQEKK